MQSASLKFKCFWLLLHNFKVWILKVRSTLGKVGAN